jgi:hypothetical protein
VDPLLFISHAIFMFFETGESRIEVVLTANLYFDSCADLNVVKSERQVESAVVGS